MNARHSDVLILGAGVIGLSCALYLLKDGARVRIVDRGEPGSGSSHGNCGTITPSHAEPLFRPGMIGKALRWMFKADAPFHVSPRPDLARLRWLLGFARRCNWDDHEHAARARAEILLHSRRLMRNLVQEERLDCRFVETGTLHVYRDRDALVADGWHAELMQRLGIDFEYLGGEQVEAMEPGLLPGVAGGVLYPGDAHVRPDQYVSALASRVRALGGEIEGGVDVDRLQRGRDVIESVHAGAQRYTADRFLMALGAWSPLLARSLRAKLPMQPGKGYSITTSQPPECPQRPLVLHEDSVCVTSWPGGYRLGSTMEFAGYARGINRVRLEALKRGARRYLRHPWGDELQEEWWGWRPMCVDELPIIGPSSTWQNLHYATAHGMMGMSMSAATGELVAAQLGGAAPAIDPEPYRPGRFGL